MREVLKTFLVIAFVLGALADAYKSGRLFAGEKIVYEGDKCAIVSIITAFVEITLAFLILLYL